MRRLGISYLLGHSSRRRNCTDGSGSGVKLVHFPFLNHLPIAVRIGIGGNTLKHGGGGTIGQRTIHDVGVPGDPSNIRGTEIYILFVIIKNVFMGDRSVDHVATSGMEYSLGLPGGSGGVENKKRILRIHLLARTIRGRTCHRLIPPQSPALLHITGNPESSATRRTTIQVSTGSPIRSPALDIA